MTELSVFELRNYLLHPGQRDALIALFEREFMETQAAVGAPVAATFRHLDDPNRFVWIRGFADMERRASALAEFYSGAHWLAHRPAANAAIVDNDDVLLPRPRTGALPTAPAPPGSEAGTSLIVATTYFLPRHGDEEFAALFAHDAAPLLREAGAAPLAIFSTEHSPNTYPRLPVRERETVFVTLTRFADAAAHAAYKDALRDPPAWRRVQGEIDRRCVKPIEIMRLQPTARSPLR